MLEYPTDSTFIHLFEVILPTDDIPNEEVTFDVNEIKYKGGNLYCYWPNYFKSDLHKDKAIQNHTPLSLEKCSQCPIVVKYSTNDYQKAMGKLQRLENNLESETESEMKKRKHKKKVYSEYEDDYSEDDLHIPVAPQPKKTTISKPKNMIQSNNNYLQHSPSQNQYDIRKKNKALLNELLRRMESMREDIKYLMKLATKNENVQVFVEEFPQFEEIEDINKFNEELSDEKVFVNACTKFQLVGGKDINPLTDQCLAVVFASTDAVLGLLRSYWDCIPWPAIGRRDAG
ncbi:hypothetical protein JTB14_025939 [Gonioctena quinquepunctata]|nr:hypothetical protein JTB14_025939 [Gonioctena quinquepunctata]